MYTAPSPMETTTRGVRDLEQCQRALERGLVEVRLGEQRTATGMAVAVRKMTDAARRAVHRDDKEIPERISRALESVCTAAGRALTEQWQRIRAMITDALERVRDELAKKKRALRGLDGGRPGPQRGTGSSN